MQAERFRSRPPILLPPGERAEATWCAVPRAFVRVQTLAAPRAAPPHGWGGAAGQADRAGARPGTGGRGAPAGRGRPLPTPSPTPRSLRVLRVLALLPLRVEPLAFFRVPSRRPRRRAPRPGPGQPRGGAGRGARHRASDRRRLGRGRVRSAPHRPAAPRAGPAAPRLTESSHLPPTLRPPQRRSRPALSAPSATPPSLVLRLLGIATLLVERVLGRAPTLLPPGELTEAIWRAVQRAFVRVQTLATTPPRPPSAAPARRRATPRPAAPPPADPDAPLSVAAIWRANREHGWLRAMMPALDDVAAQFEAWLCDRDLDALLAADPRTVRAVRALGRLLGVNPDLLPPPHRARPPWVEPDPAETALLRPVPRGYPRQWRVNQQGFALLMAERNAAWDLPPPQPA